MDQTLNNKSNIGIAILNTDRVDCLIRLLSSIQKYTPLEVLEQINIYVVDDSKDVIATEAAVGHFSFASLQHTGERIGVARNTNEALNILRKKEYSLIFNNDCEILKEGWIEFYYNATIKTGIQHFCFQQLGLWGAGTNKRPEVLSEINGVKIKTLHNYPQGALLTYTKKAFDTVGYFDAQLFHSYGKAHWLWSFSVSESGIQPKGIHDVIGSNEYFKVHNVESCTPSEERLRYYQINTEIFDIELNKIRIKKRKIYTLYYNGT